MLTAKQISDLLAQQKQLHATLQGLVKENGKTDGKPNADALKEAQVKQVTDGVIDALEAKGLFKKERKMVYGGKAEDVKEGETHATLGQYLLMAKYNAPELVKDKIDNIFKDTVMSGLSDAQGGFVLPTGFSTSIIGQLFNGTTVIPKVQPFPQSERTKNIPKWLTGPTVAWVDENGTKTLTKPTLQNKQSILKKLVVGPIPFTDEFLQDNNVGIVTQVTSVVRKAIEDEIERVILVGDVTGAGDPFNGVAFAGGNIVNQAGVNLGYSDIVATWNNAAILESYRVNPEWYLNRQALGLIMNLVDLQNRPLWNMGSLDGKIPQNILGDPLNISAKLLNTYGTGADTKLLYGDYKNVLLGNKSGAEGIAVAISNSAVSGSQNAFMQDETWYRFVIRRSIVVAIEEAFSILEKVK
ncbi:hypothetical protein LCGC14_0764660 [marine sediment metagenome]|uniref:Phage capsid-like C-terminal domain-containing protein n=1 Tax=marine sediment metagenome TaxID=412755 RepID=A0A0F9T765_9ZZZZ